MSVLGSAVLVHGLWGNPHDWWWVRQHLEGVGVEVRVPDLPSHRSSDAGLEEDAAEVRRIVGTSRAPVVLAGWSYGGDVISVAAIGPSSVARLVYVAAVPSLPEGTPADLSWIEGDAHILLGEGTYVLDNDWWLDEEAGSTFPQAVRQHLRRHPRRPVSLRVESPSKVRATPPWETIPTTVLLGTSDDLVPTGQRKRAEQCTDDIRLLETDHFIIFRRPELISGVIADALQHR